MHKREKKDTQLIDRPLPLPDGCVPHLRSFGCRCKCRITAPTGTAIDGFAGWWEAVGRLLMTRRGKADIHSWAALMHLRGQVR